jgi:hypothetical protein
MSLVGPEDQDWLKQLTNQKLQDLSSVTAKTGPQGGEKTALLPSGPSKAWKIFREISKNSTGASELSAKKLITLRKNCLWLLEQEKNKDTKKMGLVGKFRQQILLARAEGQFARANNTIVQNLKSKLESLTIPPVASEKAQVLQDAKQLFEALYEAVPPKEWQSFLQSLIEMKGRDKVCELITEFVLASSDGATQKLSEPFKDLVMVAYQKGILAEVWERISAFCSPNKIQTCIDLISEALHNCFSKDVRDFTSFKDEAWPQAHEMTFTPQDVTSESFSKIERLALAQAIEKDGFQAPLRVGQKEKS